MSNTILLLFAGSLIFNGLRAQSNAFPSSGSVGIGTTSPATLLHVVGTSSTTLTIGGTGNSAADANIFLRTGSSKYAWMLGAQNNANNVFEITPSTSAGGAAFNVPALAISQSGRVGVGTTSPSSELQVLGTTSTTITVGGTGISAADANIFLRTGSSKYAWMLGAQNNANNVFEITPSTTAGGVTFSTPALSVLQSGYIGVGTSAPTEKFSVDGNVYATGNISAFGFIKTKKLTVTQTAWPDFVFDDTYKLRSLSSLETFIKQNKHLPDVPSAKEVEENGISVGDNQALLLKKIEELTLYVIELNKKNDQLTRRITSLEQTKK